MARESRGIEPWPVALGVALASMIAVCVAFWFVAATHPDPDLLADGELPGLVAAGAGADPAPRDR